MVVLDPNLDESALEAMNTRLDAVITQRGGTITEHVDGWGRRRLAYPISRYRDGFYVLTRIQLPPNAAVEIERALRLNESVIRHLLVRTDDVTPPAAVPAAAAHE